ncbi:hypothetical protein [Pedobacter alluvionis]|uniref:Uncharacterized protein n=1 Tax=Pedobacter alluvionis TaxID=475253 RepID=A0A497Y2R5_9SPHI|nr:hypothetical protein [Pedobacter alluvionis]RLJ76794.1 hypothetical protein BCL90_1838 [Pedobacter alluvionis]TFB33940.1 hypothetical protein E3V97_07810 [Pedobacter alluvionis]
MFFCFWKAKPVFHRNISPCSSLYSVALRVRYDQVYKQRTVLEDPKNNVMAHYFSTMQLQILLLAIPPKPDESGT